MIFPYEAYNLKTFNVISAGNFLRPLTLATVDYIKIICNQIGLYKIGHRGYFKWATKDNMKKGRILIFVIKPNVKEKFSQFLSY